jgi:hypothetical protein
VTILLALDPGNTESAWLLYDTATGRPLAFAKEPNPLVLTRLDTITANELVVEMVASYGMAVGAEIFDTCVWIGRFLERWDPAPHRLIYRPDVKLHLTQTRRAKDANIRQALIDRYGPGKALAIGLKATPGPLYGLSGDCWSALAVAVTAADAAA